MPDVATIAPTYIATINANGQLVLMELVGGNLSSAVTNQLYGSQRDIKGLLSALETQLIRNMT